MKYSEWKELRGTLTKDKQAVTQTTQSHGKSANKVTYSQWKKIKQQAQTTTGNSVQDWARESGALIEKTQASVGGWFDQEQYKTQTDTLSNMITQANNFRTMYSEDDRMLESIDAVVDALISAKDHVTGYYDYYSRWDSADAYDTAKQYYQWEQTYQGKSYDELKGILADMSDGEEKTWLSSYASLVKTQKDYDNEIEQLQRQIEEMSAFFDKAYTIESWYTDYSTSAKDSRTNPELDAANMKIYNELVEKYGTLADLEALIQQKERLVKQTQRAKEENKKVSVSNPLSENYDPEFLEKSVYVDKSSQPVEMGHFDVPYEDFYGQGNEQSGNWFDDVTYEYVNGNEDVIALYADTSQNYQYMNETEVAIYNYYYATEGKESAEQYLDLIQETLNYRAAEKRYEDYKGSTFKEIMFGAAAGWDQFQSGIENFFNFSDDYIPVSETQLLAGMVRDDLGDASIPLWYNAKTGQWEEEILGNSAGQMAFDTVNTTANMLPSVLTSMAIDMIAPGVGSVVGAGMMGVSSAGNAYQEMLNLGYDQGQARAYSTLVGAAEAGLSYVIGGVSNLGGEISDHVISRLFSQVDNAFARVALKLGGNMISEGVEEALTEVLTPIFKNMTLNMNEKVDWGQVAYSGLMGALTANLFEGPGVITENVGHYRTGKSLQRSGVSAQQLAAVGKLSADEAVRALAGRVNENTGAYTLGRLFHEMGAVLTDANKTELSAALEAQGVQSGDAQIMTQALASVAEGAVLTDEQSQMLEANDVLSRTAVAVLDVNVAPVSGENGDPSTPGTDTADPSLSLRTSPQTGVAISNENPTGLTTQQALEQAIENVSGRPIDPKTYNALFSYKNQLQHRNTTQSLLDQKRRILQQQQAAGANPADIQRTQTDIATLEKMLAAQQQKLNTTAQSSVLQQAAQKAHAQLAAQQQMQGQEQNVENGEKTVVDISADYARIKAENHVITDGSHIENGKLKPNVTYQTGEHPYIYKTNSDGLIETVYVETLQEKTHEGRLEHDPNTYGKEKGDHAGHLIGDRFGGSPELDNLVSQAALVNLGKYKRIENQWGRAIKAGKKVSVEIQVNYGEGVRPTSFTVTYQIDGKTTTKTIKNSS